MPSPDLRHYRERIAGRQTAWAQRGGEGIPVVLVPGLSMSWRAYGWLMEHLDPRRPVVIIDPPGCGRSQSLPGTLTASAAATHLARVLNRIGVDHADVVGHSFGAVMAARLAAQKPQLVNTVALISPSPDTDYPHVGHHVLALLRGLPSEAPRVLSQAVTDYVRSNPRVLAGFAAELRTPASEMMEGVHAPVLVIRGSDDEVSGSTFCADLARAGKGMVLTLPEAAHGLPQQRPQDLAQALSRFHAQDRS